MIRAGVGSLLELLFFQHLKERGLEAGCERELVFAPPRKWRFDFAWPEQLVAVELEGGSWVAGRHTRGKAFEEDCHKYNTATRIGWSVYRFTSDWVEDGRAIAFMAGVLSGSRTSVFG